MNKAIHLSENNIDVLCNSCKNKFKIQTSEKSLTIDICSKCHPFYTNKSFSSRSVGRVEKFKRKYQKK